MSSKQSIGGLLSNLNQEFKEREVIERAKTLDMTYINLKTVPINTDLLELVDAEEAQKAQVMPFFRNGNKIRVAIVDLDNEYAVQVLDKLREKKFEITLSLCSAESMAFARKAFSSKLYFEQKDVVADDSEKAKNTFSEIESIAQLPEKMMEMRADEALNLLHTEILKLSASDLHFEPRKFSSHVRARIDGVLTSLFEVSHNVAEGLIRQIKHLSRLKLNVRNVPQDGKYSFQTLDRLVDVRVSILPVKSGESVVMRFLDPKRSLLPLDKLGFAPKALTRFQESLQATNGLILTTGPTGSGKTTTLHSALSSINTPDKKIITIEDPVEFQVEGIVQCEAHEDVGLTFAAGLRSILRQDPNVVMIGEIRDQETAETAVQASLTGHLVLSTLHTNSAADAIPRLLNMGVMPFVFAPAIKCIIAQRLVRRVCPKCVEMSVPNESEKKEIMTLFEKFKAQGEALEVPQNIPHAKGCEECSNTGYRGEVVVAEVLVIDDQVRSMIYKTPTSAEIMEVAQKNGMRNMWEEGVCKVLQGETTFAEVAKNIGRQ